MGWMARGRAMLPVITAVVLTIGGGGQSVRAATGSTAASRVAGMAARDGGMAARSVEAAGSFNPVAAAQGFTVFVRGNATLSSSVITGPTALGGNLAFGPATFSVATQTAGSFTAAGDARPTGLLVGGTVNWAGTSPTGTLSVQNSGYVKIGDMTGTAVAQSGSSPTHVVPSGHTYAQLPQIAETVTQPTASVSQSGLIDFAGAFGTLAGQSGDLGSCTANVALTAANGTPLTSPFPPSTNAFITLTPSTVNVLTISATDLNNIAILNFRNAPTATMPLIINVTTGGVGNAFTWTLPNINGFSSSAAQYLLWNFPTATQLTISGSQTVQGTVDAPGAAVSENDTNGVNGGVVAASYSQGVPGGSGGGQVSAVPFAATVASCATTAVTIALTADTTTAAPGQIVHYTVAVTNSGNTAITGATFTQALADVLDDATYRNDAAATAGTVSFTSPNLTWTGNLAAGSGATITFSVAVDNPDSGNDKLVTTITSATTGSNCPSGGTDARCSSTIAVSVLTISATASTPTTTPGSIVGYTVTITNAGQVAYTGAAVTDSLSGLLDDAAYNADGTASAGSLTFASPNLTWTGNLAIGASATITFSATVKSPDPGDGMLTTTITSATAGNNCPGDSTDSRCKTSVTVLVPGLKITTSADTGTTTPGSTVRFTVTVTDTGHTPYTGAVVTDSLAGVLNDASYNNDARATGGSVSYSSPNLTWTGDLAIGAAVTITFSATVSNPDTGSKLLVNTVTSNAAGSTCPSGGSDPDCSVSVRVLVPGLTIATSASASTSAPGGTVRYTIRVTNTGDTAFTGAAFTAPLSGVLDDAAYNNDGSATAGTVSFGTPNLTWTGDLAVGAVATITFSVTVASLDTGNHVLAFTVTSSTSGSNCPSGGTDPQCSVTVTIAQLRIVNGSDVGTTTPGGIVRFTATFTNTGQVPYTGITVATDATDVFDDAIPNGDQTATSGTLVLTSTGISWTGNIPVGGTVTVTGTVTVKDPDPGNKVLAATLTSAAPGNNCPSGGSDQACSVNVQVLVPALSISQSADASSAVPGQKVTYTVTVADTGQTSYTGAVVTEQLLLLDDATYNNDAVTTRGSLSYASPNLTWTGDLSPGQSAVITFSVRVNSPDTGDKQLTVSLSATEAGSTCPPDSPNTGCTVTVPVLTPQLTITKTASPTTAIPGQTVSYTITVRNTGQIPYTGISVTDSLAGVLDDATYNNDASASAGSVTLSSATLTWTGNLAVGAPAVTVTYTVTVNNPDTGDKTLTNTATSTAAGSLCPPATPDPSCTATVSVVNATTLTFTAASAQTSTTAGSVVHYTITVSNSGVLPYIGATFSEPLSDVLDDATYNGDVSASAGLVLILTQTLTWTGTVPASGTVTITYSVTVHSSDTGDKILTSTVSSISPGSNCPAASTDPRCTVTVTVSELLLTQSTDVTTTTPGGVVRITATFTNTGKTPYDDISVAAGATDVFDDAFPNGDETATSGTLVLTATGITWSGDIPVGGSVTVTGTVTVTNPDPGNKVLAGTLTSAAPGNNCPAGTSDPQCSIGVRVLVPQLSISHSADATSAVPGQTVTFTMTIADTGQTSYTAARVTEHLLMLDDATYDNDAVASTGSVSFASPDLIWAGNLSPGQSAVITYSVRVKNPDTGDKQLTANASSTEAGSACPPDSPNAGCTITVAVLTPGLTLTIAASPATAVPGGTVSYTITVANTGQTPQSGLLFTESLAGVLDDAAYDNDARTTSGTVAFSSPNVTLTASLNPAGSLTVTFSVTVNNSGTGNKTLATTLVSAAAGSNCPAGGTDPRCASTVPVAVLTVTNAASVSTTTPGSVVSYTVTVTDSGQTSYSGAQVTDPLAGVLDDARFNNDGNATSGSVAFTSPDLTWTGNLAPGDSAVITFSVTVSDPDAGDKSLVSTLISADPGSTCPSGGADLACTATVTVLIPVLQITKTASASTTTPGSTIGYTIRVRDAGPTSYSGAVVSDSLSGILPDAVYNGDAVASAGTVRYVSPDLTWTGSLGPGATVTITYTVTVRNPDPGDKRLINTVTSADQGSTCPPAAPGPDCTVIVQVLVPALTITKTANAATTTPGSAVGYTITVTNTGQTAYSPAHLTDSLVNVLSDANFDGHASATGGTVSYARPSLTWTGDLAVGASATITYSVTVLNPDTGGRIIINTAVSADPGSTCPAGSGNPACTVAVPVLAGELSISVPVTAFLGSTVPGGTVSAGLGAVIVTDNRGFGADWTAAVSGTNFTTGSGSPAETIPGSDVTYRITALDQTTGPADFTFVPFVSPGNDPAAVVQATDVQGNTSVTWTPLIEVRTPESAISGPYTAVITHSVS